MEKLSTRYTVSFIKPIFVLICLLASGCASIVNDDTQLISIQTTSENTIKATVQNDKFVTRVELPANVLVKRSSDDIIVTLHDECYKIIKNNEDTVNTDNFHANMEPGYVPQPPDNTKKLTDSKFVISPTLSGAVAGNLLFFPLGTVITAGVDLATSRAWSYDDIIVIPVEKICEDSTPAKVETAPSLISTKPEITEDKVPAKVETAPSLISTKPEITEDKAPTETNVGFDKIVSKLTKYKTPVKIEYERFDPTTGSFFPYLEHSPKTVDDVQRVAEKGDAKAQFNLGVMYDNGQGVSKDLAKAIQWYQRAADNGDAKSQFNLGIMYGTGEGVQRNDTTAVQWFQKAAKQGDATAQEILTELAKAEAAKSFKIRNDITWGMTKSEVKQSENIAIHKEDEDSISYKDKLFEAEVTVVYIFHNNKLYRAEYRLNKDVFSNNEGYINTYNKIIATLTDKYGQPKKRISPNNNSLQWTTDNTKIEAEDGAETTVSSINYISIDIEKEKREIIQKVIEIQEKKERSKL